MEPFSIEWRSSTSKDIRGLPRQDVARIIAAIGQLAGDPLPHGCHKLAGSERTSRLRIGDYRVIYEVFSGQISLKCSA
jgi:mRNA interferase RelE/StbE